MAALGLPQSLRDQLDLRLTPCRVGVLGGGGGCGGG